MIGDFRIKYKGVSWLYCHIGAHGISRVSPDNFKSLSIIKEAWAMCQGSICELTNSLQSRDSLMTHRLLQAELGRLGNSGVPSSLVIGLSSVSSWGKELQVSTASPATQLWSKMPTPQMKSEPEQCLSQTVLDTTSLKQDYHLLWSQ